MRTVTASAPGRVNLIGEHLDYNGGLCLPIAIDRRTTVSIAGAETTTLHSTHEPRGWERYVLGVLEALDVTEPLSIEVTSDVPLGAGLSSSAALTCATALALDSFLELGRSRDELAQACIRAENEYVGVPTGGMDQRIALFAQPGHALLLDFATGTQVASAWRPEQDGIQLLVVDTRVQHALLTSPYAERRATCAAAARLLAPVPLVEADEDLIAHLPPLEQRRARHVVTEQRRVRACVDAAAARSWDRVGALMTASHWSLRDDYEVSCAELDTVVEIAVGAGAAGARMTGGGFGGSVLVLVSTSVTEQVTASVLSAFARNGWEAPTVFPVEASRGAEVDQLT